eukprot:4822154-Amphidinium_carterae.1
MYDRKHWPEVKPTRSTRQTLNGKPLGRSCFAGAPVLRLVINMVPQNQLQEIVNFGLDELPYFGQWIPIELEDDQTLVWSSEDIKCAFYIFRMPQAWRKHMVLSQPIWLGSRRRYLASAVLPMGWCFAVSVCQRVHRNFVRQCGLPGRCELRKGKVLTASPGVALDNKGSLDGLD